MGSGSVHFSWNPDLAHFLLISRPRPILLVSRRCLRLLTSKPRPLFVDIQTPRTFIGIQTLYTFVEIRTPPTFVDIPNSRPLYILRFRPLFVFAGSACFDSFRIQPLVGYSSARFWYFCFKVFSASRFRPLLCIQCPSTLMPSHTATGFLDSAHFHFFRLCPLYIQTAHTLSSECN